MTSKAGFGPCSTLPGHRQARIERAFADLDRELGDVDAVGGGEHRGALRLTLHNRLGQHVGRQPVDRGAGREAARIDADHPAVIGARGDVLRLSAEELRASGGETRFRLRHVGPRHLADIETVARLLELLGKHLDVAPLQIEHRPVAQQVHIGGRGVEQHLLLGDAQCLARTFDLAFGLASTVRGLQTVVQRVRAGGADGARIEILRKLAGRRACPPSGKTELEFW